MGYSHFLTATLIGGHMLGATSILLLPWGHAARLSWLMLAGMFLVREMRRVAWKVAMKAVIFVKTDGQGRVLLILRNGQRLEGRLKPGSFVAPFLVILRWQAKGGVRVRHIAIAADATDADNHRKLRVLLRHPL